MLTDEIIPYTDADGFIGPKMCEPTDRNVSGNNILYSSLFFILLCLRDDLSDYNRKSFEALVRSCQPLPQITGVYTRGPAHNDKNTTFDDYTAALVASKYLNNNVAFEILEHGRQSLGVYNTHLEKLKNPIKQFLWRNPSFFALSRVCTGLDAGFFGVFALGAVWWNIFRLATHIAKYDKGQDSELFSWLVIRGFDWQDKLTGKLFEHLIESRFGNVNEIMKRVLQDANHPLVKYFVY